MQSIISQRLSKDIVFMEYIIVFIYFNSHLMCGCHFHNFKYIVILEKGESNQQFNIILVEIIES